MEQNNVNENEIKIEEKDIIAVTETTGAFGEGITIDEESIELVEDGVIDENND